jgi:5-methylcytosine-specific restriction endonuclease McrA
LVKGGKHDRTNIVIACPHCNDSKGAKLPQEWAGRLL